MKISQLSYTFPRGNQPFFDELSFELPEHQVNFLIGQNGAGKTTLADILLGLRPFKGQITPSLTSLYLNQQLPMLTSIRVSDVAALVLGIETGQRHLTLAKLQPLVDAPTLAFLTPIWAKHYRELSGGQRKLVQLLLFLQVDRELVVLDEPTAMIDRQHAATLFATMRAHPDRTYLMITHDVRDLAAFPNYQVLWLADHQIKASIDRATFEAGSPDSDFMRAFQAV